MKKNDELASIELQRILLAARTITEFSMERVLALSMEHVLVQNVPQLTRNFGVPTAFYFAFYLRSSNGFRVRFLLSGTVYHVI